MYNDEFEFWHVGHAKNGWIAQSPLVVQSSEIYISCSIRPRLHFGKKLKVIGLDLEVWQEIFLAHFFANFVFSLRFRTVGAKNKIFFGLTFFDFYLENFLIKLCNVQLPPHGATTKYPNNICWLSLTRTNLSFESNEHYTVFQYLTSYNAHIGGLLCSK